jgi:hypothetical protein
MARASRSVGHPGSRPFTLVAAGLLAGAAACDRGCAGDAGAPDAGAAAAAPAPGRHLLHRFRKRQLTDQFWAEGASFADLDRDGHADVVAGPYWWAGPDFARRRTIYPDTQTFTRPRPDGTSEVVPGFEGALGRKNAYSDNFFVFPHDFDRDGFLDLLVVGFPGEETRWYRNPAGVEGPWERHLALARTDNESPTFADVTGDGVPELVCASGGAYGYAAPDPTDPRRPFVFHPLTPDRGYGPFTHGLGIGDVDGDGAVDLLEKDGVWRRPAGAGGTWTFSPQRFGSGGAQMYAFDVDGDGRHDVVTSLAAHGFGLSWFRQRAAGAGLAFDERAILGRTPAENRYGVAFPELHAVAVADVDGDRLPDVVTGNRTWAHGPAPAGEVEPPPVLYWFRLVRGPGGDVDFVPHLVDDASGVGTQLVAGDVDGDRRVDLVVANKRGVFLFLHEAAEVDRATWEAAQPKPR